MMPVKPQRGRWGRKAGGEPTVTVYLRLPREFARRLQAQAAAADRSLSNFLWRTIRDARSATRQFSEPST